MRKIVVLVVVILLLLGSVNFTTSKEPIKILIDESRVRISGYFGAPIDWGLSFQNFDLGWGFGQLIEMKPICGIEEISKSNFSCYTCNTMKTQRVSNSLVRVVKSVVL